jgi:hypothetical protein
MNKQLSRRRAILLLVFALATAWSMAGGASATPALGALAGTVTDAQGKPVGGATVTMETSDAKRPYATHTGADGRFQFSRFRPGQYDLRAYAGGVFSEWSKRVMIHTGKTTEITLHIPAPNAKPGATPAAAAAATIKAGPGL